MLRFMGLQRVGHNLATEQQEQTFNSESVFLTDNLSHYQLPTLCVFKASILDVEVSYRS